MRFIFVFGLIAALASVVICRNATWGNYTRGDKLLFRRTVLLYPKVGKPRTRYVTYGPRINKYTITGIFVVDNFKNASGPVADIQHGGVGQSFAVVRLVSPKSQGMNSTVTVIGKIGK